MKLPRISIKKLMQFVALVACVVAALSRPSYGWANLLTSCYILMLLVAPLGAFLNRGPRQAHWLGFGLFGWVFFLATSFLSDGSCLGSSVFWGRQVSYGFNAIWINVSVLFVDLFYVFSSLSDLSNREPGVVLTDYGKVDYFSTCVVSLAIMGLAFAYLGSRIARFLAKGGSFDPPPTTPA